MARRVPVLPVLVEIKVIQKLLVGIVQSGRRGQ